MARASIPLIAFNRGIIDQIALARVDQKRTLLSAEIMTNWLPKTQGAMVMRPGTKYLGSSLNDTGAIWVEFVAATDDTALLELTPKKMRVWIDGALMGRPKVTTTVAISDTGWTKDNIGGGGEASTPTNIIPIMTGPTTDGVTITASSENIIESAGHNHSAWIVGSDNYSEIWADTGLGGGPIRPSWVNVDFGSVAGGKKVLSYSIRAGWHPDSLDNQSIEWSLLGADYDTGTYATDTGKWALEDYRVAQPSWSISEERDYTLTDTGTADTWRHWRYYVIEVDGDTETHCGKLKLFDTLTGDTGQIEFGSQLTMNAGAIGATARARKRVPVAVPDQGVVHSLDVHVSRGPVKLRVGSQSGDDDLISETNLSTGYHNLAFTPSAYFHITLQTTSQVDRIISSLGIGDSGTVEITTPWASTDLDNIRYDQSADVTFVNCKGVHPYRIERRGTGVSWSVVEYVPYLGPFKAPASDAKLNVSNTHGNTTLTSDIPFFKPGHVGSLFKLEHDGQGGSTLLGFKGAFTAPIEINGISDTGNNTIDSERRILFVVTGTYSGKVEIQRSFDGRDYGFSPIIPDFLGGSGASDTGTTSFTVSDKDDNLTVWYRAQMIEWDDTGSNGAGTALVTATHGGGATSGIVKATGFRSNTVLDVEIISIPSDTGATDVWDIGVWSGVEGYPQSVAIHEGRLSHAGRANIWLSASNDYHNFDDEITGESAPLSRTLGSGPVDNIFYLVSMDALLVGTFGSEIALRSSALSEPITKTNAAAKAFSTLGSANIRAFRHDSEMVMVHRSRQKVYLVAPGFDASSYEPVELTVLVPSLLESGIVSVAVQRQPDSRFHFCLADGTVAILTYEKNEEVLAWSRWVSDSGYVERVMVLPGTSEDNIFYHVRRVINGTTRRFLEQWAPESKTSGDTGLTWLSDCAVSVTDTGRAHSMAANHLIGSSTVVWADDTGQADAGRDMSYDTGGVQKVYVVDTGGDTSLDTGSGGYHHAVIGLPFTSDWKSTKLAYGAEGGSALAQMKRTDRIAFVLKDTHNNAIQFGNDTGNMDPLPRVIDNGDTVDRDKIFKTFDKMSMSFPGLWDEDSRILIRGKSPRPAKILAGIPSVKTNER